MLPTHRARTCYVTLEDVSIDSNGGEIVCSVDLKHPEECVTLISWAIRFAKINLSNVTVFGFVILLDQRTVPPFSKLSKQMVEESCPIWKIETVTEQGTRNYMPRECLHR